MIDTSCDHVQAREWSFIKWGWRKSWICIWLRKFQYMMTDTSCDHVHARDRLYIASTVIAFWMHRCICVLFRIQSLKKLLYWCESLFLGAVVCIRRGVHIEGESANFVFRERISRGLLPDSSSKFISPIVKAFDVLLIPERSWLLWHREQVFVLDWKLLLFNFNLKSNLPSLFSEQTTVLGKVLELIFLEC